MEDAIKQKVKEAFEKLIPSSLLLFKSIQEVNFSAGHPYTVGPKHIKYASEHHSGILGNETCKAVPCAHFGCRLSYDEHKYDTVLFVQLPRNVYADELQKVLENFQEVLTTVLNELYPDKYKTISDIFDGWAFVDTPEGYRIQERKEIN